ncbi:MAG: TRAP transporter TatT component family protein [candidate division KSB1 bacterium]|nr:TRAP transporter TatT component family protein [candidate division KSB1 bacterium]
MRECFRKSSLPFFALGMLFAACAGRRSVILEPLAVAVPNPTAAAILRAEADKLWQQRDDPQKARQALATYQQAFAANPVDVALGTRLARAYHFVASYIETKPEAQDTLFQRGVETGERTLALNSNFRMIYQKTREESKALAALDKSWVNPIYWTGANLEGWTKRQGQWVRYGNKHVVEAYFTRLRELEPNLFYGAVYRFFGALPTQVPFGSLDESKREFEKAIEVAPKFLGNYRAYAENYAVARKDRDLFKKLLLRAINGNPKALPDVSPENKFEQAIAKKMLDEIDKYIK